MEDQNTWSFVACRPPFAAWYALSFVFLEQSLWTKDETETNHGVNNIQVLQITHPHWTLSIKIYWSEWVSDSDLGILMFWVSNPVPKSQMIIGWAMSPLQTWQESQMLQRPIYLALSEIKGRRRQFEDLVILYKPKLKIVVLNYL